MKEITILEKDLEKELKNLIIGKGTNEKDVLKRLNDFFHSKKQKDIDKLNPTNIRLFTVALEILQNNKKLSKVHLANLDYIYSYRKEPLKYLWKSCEFNLIKDSAKIKDTLLKITNGLKFNKVKSKKVFDFLEQADEMCKEKYSSDTESLGLFNKNKDSFVFLDYDIFDDDYRNERICEVNILLVTEDKKLLDILPNNEGTTYSNLIFRNNDYSNSFK